MEQLSQSRTVDSDGNYLLKSPPGFPTIPSSSNEDLSLNLLQNYSINSLLEHEDFLWNNDGETTSVSDLLGLNSPRGLLNLNFSNSVCTPSSSSQNPQGNYEEGSFGGCKPKTRVKTFQRNISLGSAGSSPTSPPFLGRSFRSMSFSDSCGSNSPALYEQHPILGRNFSRSDSVDVNAARNSNNTDLNDILNQLSLSDTLTRNLMATAPISDLDLSQLQNLQAIHAMKYLQQAPTFRQSNVTNNAQLLEKWQVNQQQQHLNTLPENSPLDRAAKFHRSAASVYDAVCTWSGVLPPCTDKCSAGYSSKVFLGGIPWDMSEECLVQAFRQFGPVSIEWPGKEKQANQPKGYAYLVLESEKSVRDLLSQCVNRYENSGSFYFKICSKRIKMKEVQVIPWFLSDSNYTKSASQKLDPSKTVFVGALHGTLTAQGLAKVMNDLFDGVVYAGIDTDKYKYPIGSGRVTFNNSRSYMKAVSAAFIEIKTSKFSKKVQVDPYLEESLCSLCGVQQGPYFCRDITCFRYYCRTCWSCQHGTDLRHHNPMSRNSKHNLQQGGLFGNASNKTGLRL